MRTPDSPETGASHRRVLAASVLCSGAVVLAALSFAATPPNGALTDTSGPQEYTAGPFFEPNAFGNTIAACYDPTGGDATAPCDVYRLSVALPENYATTNPNQSVFGV